MSDAIDNADVMLYGVSEKYKESGNCRLEANYAHQQDVDMIPLLVEKDYRPKGWLGLIMGEPRLKTFSALRACATNSHVVMALQVRACTTASTQPRATMTRPSRSASMRLFERLATAAGLSPTSRWLRAFPLWPELQLRLRRRHQRRRLLALGL